MRENRKFELQQGNVNVFEHRPCTLCTCLFIFFFYLSVCVLCFSLKHWTSTDVYCLSLIFVLLFMRCLQRIIWCRHQFHIILAAQFSKSTYWWPILVVRVLACFWPSTLQDWVLLFGWNNREEALVLARGKCISEELFIIPYSHYHRLMD